MNKAERAEYMRKYNLNRKKNGICLNCGKPAREGRVYCFECGVYYAQRSADYYRRKREAQNEQKH